MAYFARHLLAKWTQGEWINSRPSDEISGFSIDSRKIGEKDMFIALKSDVRDGHAFITDAEKRGATAALTEQYVADSRIPQLKVKKGVNAFQSIAHQHRNSFTGPVVAITGSCGKTSTKDLLSHLLGESSVLKTAGNLNNYLGVPLTLLRLDSSRHQFGIIEAGINMPEEMKMLAEIIDADYGIVTMVGRSHLKYLKDLETVAREKAELLMSGKQKQGVVYPSSCLKYRAFTNLDNAPNHVLTPLGQGLPNRGWLHPVYYWCVLDDQKRWNLFLRHENGTQRQFVIPNMSPGMRQNLALSLFSAGELGVSDAQMQKRLFDWYPSDNRGQLLQSDKSWIYSDCYNANPDSMRDSLEAFHSTFGSEIPRLYVLGSMYELGDDAENYHREIAARLDVKESDRVVCIGKYAPEYLSGLRYAGVNEANVICSENAIDAKGLVDDFEGAIFLKGSRMNHLEELIPSEAKKVVLDSGKLS